ncbi:MAG: tetratricopeptide repeat protein, partial [Planctomycetaceae bacterium]
MIIRPGFDVRFCVLLCLAGLLLPTRTAAQRIPPAKVGQYVIVTATTGYLLGAKGEVRGEVPTWTLAEVKDVRADSYLVNTLVPRERKGRTVYLPMQAWINKNLVHVTSFREESDEDLQVAQTAIQALIQSDKAAATGNFADSVRLSTGALKGIESYIGRYNEFYPWLLAGHAYKQSLNGDDKGAEASLSRAANILPQVDYGEVHKADFWNVRAILLAQRNQHEDAVGLYELALNVSRKYLGQNHSDYRIIAGNLAGSYAALGRSAEAVRAQKQAYDITRKIVPDGVAERYLYARGLGVVL